MSGPLNTVQSVSSIGTPSAVRRWGARGRLEPPRAGRFRATAVGEGDITFIG